MNTAAWTTKTVLELDLSLTIQGIIVSYLLVYSAPPAPDLDAMVWELDTIFPKISSNNQNLTLLLEGNLDYVDYVLKHINNGIIPGWDSFNVDYPNVDRQFYFSFQANL